MEEEIIQTTEEVTDEVEPETETKPVEQDQQTPPNPPAPEPEETVDFWKTKFSESAGENQRLVLAQKAREIADQELTKEPTDSELRTAFPSWDLYDEPQKEFARRTFGAERTALNAARISQDLRDERSWNTSIELVVSSNPALQGKEQAFKQYASQPKYRNVPMDVLVAAFLGTAAPSEPPKPTPKPGLETGNGGPRTPEKPKGLSASELSALRASDERAYDVYVKTHDIDVDNL